jgi:HlyD family secretion protein
MAASVRLLRSDKGLKASTKYGDESLRRLVLISLAVVLGAVILFFANKRAAPPVIPFTKVTRDEIVSAFSTNGKVEPIEWAEAHSEAGGLIEKVLIQKGQHVAKGAPLVQLDSREALTELASAEARVTSAQAELQTLRQGGRSSDVASIQSALSSARLDQSIAQRDYDAEVRLQAKNAATAEEVRAAKDRLEKAQQQIEALNSRRSTLVNRPDIAAAEGRLHEAEAAVAAAKVRLSMMSVRSPIAGVVYQMDLKAGSYLHPGDLVASIGNLDRVRVVVYVDEPDLGRVAVNEPVTITWDAMPGREWKGIVSKPPSQVVPLGTRQVGEVICVIDNPEHNLLPGTNVNVEIRSRVVPDALVVPTGAIRRQDGEPGVFLLKGDVVEWRNVTLGVSSAVRTQVFGLNAGDSVALPTDRVLKNGMKVTPAYP